MYTYVRLAHIVLFYVKYSLVTNQTACALVNNFHS